INNLFLVSSERPSNPNEPEPTQMAYAPTYALCNTCIAAWMVYWTNGWFWAAQIMVTTNYFLGSSSPFALSRVNVATHLVAKTFAGISVLDFLDNGAVAARYAGPPSAPVQTLTIILFFLMHALSSDFTFSLCMCYDLMALIVDHPLGDPHWALHSPSLGL
ncbi:hypothetical protein F5I97DRAFT_1810054, partial [Phlebopus sp. FC_14]